MDTGKEKTSLSNFMVAVGNTVSLRYLNPSDATSEYVSWLNDPEINQFTESRFFVHTKESVEDFISKTSNDSNHAFAIIDNESGLHIGNIKIGNINSKYQYADIGLIIGNKKFWGKGIASEAIKLCVGFAFSELKLHRLWAGIYALNIGSVKAFERAGFVCEGTERKKYLFKGEWIDSFVYGIVNENIQ